MNLNLDTFKVVAPAFAVGALLMALAKPSLKDGGHLEFDPNPGAIAKSPYGRTVGMALQGPITRFWDLGVGSIEKPQELGEADTPDEVLFNFVSKLRDAKSKTGVPSELSEVYQDYAMARIEKKLSLAWEMDPRNFANYAIYQMFLWEGFNDGIIDVEMNVRELSRQTLESSLADNESPLSLLTAGQAAYDLVFAARTSKEQSAQETFEDIDTYSRMLPSILESYEELVATMQEDGRWDEYSAAKKEEFEQRKAYLEHLNNETRTVVEQLTNSEEKTKGGRNS